MNESHKEEHAPGGASDRAQQQQKAGGVLIVTAVEAERQAILRGWPDANVVAVGVGAAVAAAGTAAALAANAASCRLVISAGIGGGFSGQAAIGSLVLADSIIAADLGAQTLEGGFHSVEELGFGSSRIAASPQWSRQLLGALQAAGLAVCSGPILTVNTATGTADRAAALAARVPGAAAEAMEGHGVAAAAAAFGIPVAEIRAISNAVGPRDRAAWRIGDALAALEAGSKAIQEVFK
jgi:futalosine hydrolase